MTRRVLFVDDEPNVLDGLRRAFRPLRGTWDMRFARSGSEALERVAAEPADVLVTDMRMPGMDGDELLAAVRRECPGTVRMVLTGQCTRDAILRLVPLAHAVFTKPCDPDDLRASIARACFLRDRLGCPDLIALVGQVSGLPSPPSLYAQILAELERPDGSLAVIGDLIARDVGLAAKVMQVANSPLFGIRQQAATPDRAVQILGLETTRGLVVASELISRFDPAPLLPFSIDDLWDHSRLVAELARQVARAAGPGAGADAWLAGLVHDIGRLALASGRPESYKEALRAVRSGGQTLASAERRVFGATHAEVGAYLIGLWGLATPLVEAVAWHHHPSAGPGGGFGPLAAVHVAETLLSPEEAGPPDGDYVGRLGLDGRLAEWAERARGIREGRG